MGDKCTTVTKRPPCDLCWLFDRKEVPAYADAKVRDDCPIYGWAYVCRRHFREQDCKIGDGRGARLVLPKRKNPK